MWNPAQPNRRDLMQNDDGEHRHDRKGENASRA